MLYDLVRAIFASFLPMLPVFFRVGKLSFDWTRSLPGTLAPQYLPPGNITTETHNLAHDLDDTLTVNTLISSGTWQTTHPFFDAFAAIVHTISPGLSFPSFWQLVLPFILLLLPTAIWGLSSTCIRILKHAFSTDKHSLVLAIEDSRDDTPIPPSPTCQVVGEKPSSNEVVELLPVSETLSSPPLSSSSSAPASPSMIDLVSQILSPWHEPVDPPESFPMGGDLQRSRSLSDIVEQSEGGESDVEAHDTPRCEWFSGILGCAQDLIQRSPSISWQSTPSLADATLTGTVIPEDGREDISCPVPREEPLASTPPLAELCSGATPDESVTADPVTVVKAPIVSPSSMSEDPIAALPPSSVEGTIALPPPPPPPSEPHIPEDASASTSRPQAARSRRASSVLVSRLGMPGQQIALTSAGIEYAVSQLQAHAGAGTAVRDERRRLDRVVTDVVDVFSESRGAPRPRWLVLSELHSSGSQGAELAAAGIQQNIIDGGPNPPLKIDAQSRRPMCEVGRSRSGTGTHPTSRVLLERNAATRQTSSFTPAAEPVVGNAVDGPPQRQRASTEQAVPLAVPSVGRTRSAAPLSYAAVAAKPAPAPAPAPVPRARVVSEQMSAAVHSGTRRRTLSVDASASTTPRRPVEPSASVHPLISFLMTPNGRPRYTSAAAAKAMLSAREASQVTPTPLARPPPPPSAATPTPAARPTSWRDRHTSASDNWRAPRLAGDHDRALSAEFASTPPSRLPVPAAFVPPQVRQSAMRPSMISATARAQLRDLAERASKERADVVKPLSGGVRAADPFWVTKADGVERRSTTAAGLLENITTPARPLQVPAAAIPNVESSALEDDESESEDGSSECDSDESYESATDGSEVASVVGWRGVLVEDDTEECGSPQSSDGFGTASESSRDDEVLLFADRYSSKVVSQEVPVVSVMSTVVKTSAPLADDTHPAPTDSLAVAVVGNPDPDSPTEEAPSNEPQVEAPASPSSSLDLAVVPSTQPALRIFNRLGAVDMRSRIQQLGRGGLLGQAVPERAHASTGRPSATPAPATPGLRSRILQALSFSFSASLTGSARSVGSGSGADESSAESSGSDGSEELSAGSSSVASETRVVLANRLPATGSVQATRPSAPLYSEVVESSVVVWRSRGVSGEQTLAVSCTVTPRSPIVQAFQRSARLLLASPRTAEISDFSGRHRLRRSTAPAGPLDDNTADFVSEVRDAIERVRRVSRKAAARSRRASRAASQQGSSSITIVEDDKAAPAPVPRPLARYSDPWEFEDRPSADLEVANRGHQAIPHGLGKHKRAATTAARMRTSTAQGFAGENIVRRRGFTGGWFDLLESDVILA